MFHWKVWNYFVISHLLRNLIGFFEEVWKLCNTNLIGQSKVLPTMLSQKRRTDAVFNFGQGRRRSSLFPSFFEPEREQPACFLIATCWQNSKSIKRRCSVSSKVQTLAVCWKAPAPSAWRRDVQSRLLGVSARISKLEYDASVSCRRTKGRLVF